MSPVIFFAVLALIAIGVGVYVATRRSLRRSLAERLELKLYSVRLPLQSREGKQVLDEIAISERLFGALLSFRKPFALEVAVPNIGEEIRFYVSVPGRYGDALTRQVHSLWDGADVRPSDDYNVFNYAGVTAAAWVQQRERFVLPIRTYREVNSDTFLSLMGGLTKINQVGEGGAIQVIARPAAPKQGTAIRSALGVLRKGWKLKDVLKNNFAISISDVTEATATKPKAGAGADQPVIDEPAIKALESKLAKPLFEVNVRLVASAPSQFQADSILDGLAAGFSQFGATDRNELKVVRPRNTGELAYQFSFRLFQDAQNMVLNTEELASLFHFPTAFTEMSRIAYLKAREAPPPVTLPADGVLIGESTFRGEARPVRISDDDRRRHVYIIGQTGTGKSTLLTNMVVDDISRGKGVALIDPHGSFVGDVLGLVPSARVNDVVVFDPSDLARPIGLNMLEYDVNQPEQKTFIVNELIGIFDKLYDLKTTGGPMFEQYMRNAVQLLMEDAPNEPATLTEIPRVFTDAEFRSRKLARIRNPIVVDFWVKEAAKAGGEAALQNITPYITSKFNVFLTNDYVRPIIGQVHSSLNFRQLMDQGKILVVNLAKGRIGDINAGLLGMVIIGKLLMAALSRVDLEESRRRDFNLFVDEFQNFTTDSVAGILSEARKYRLSLTIAHQFIAQLTERIRDAVFGNVGSVISFRVGAQDAEFLVKQFEPTFGAQDLINIDNFHAYVRLLVRGQTTPPFNVRMQPVARGNPALAAELKERSRMAYGRDRETVEQEIHRRLRT